MDGPPILQSEMDHAISRMKRGKAAGGDQIAVEMIVTLEEYRMEKFTKFANKMNDPGTFPI